LIVAVDVGGTFTDGVAIDSGEVKVLKVSTVPTSPEVGVMEVLSKFTGVTRVIHATTIATNALLGQVHLELPKVALLTTEGFKDVIEIGRQNRPELYNPFFKKPRPLVGRDMRFEVRERISSSGEVIVPLDEEMTREAVEEARKRGAVSLAICFLHSYLNPENEVRAKRIAQGVFKYVVASHEVSPTPREYERTSTTVINAMLMPIMRKYLNSLAETLEGVELFVMSSAGGLVHAREVMERPVQVIESGPAAGVVGVSALSRLLGEPNSISFDMGGTTAKAGTVVDYHVETTDEYEVGGRTHHGRTVKGSGYPVRFPFVDLAEVSAGGGTVIWRDDEGALRLGPISAGADPGPMSYGKGGVRPTLTDANLLLGRIGISLSEGVRLDRGLAEEGLKRLGDPTEVALDAISLANLEMARAIRLVTVERGLDPAGFTLFAFGGAGPQHALDLAEEMGVRKVVIPPHPGLFSSLSMLFADQKFEATRSYPRDLEKEFQEMEAGLRKKVPEATQFLRYAEVRYQGQGWELTIPVGDTERVEEDFQRRHLSTYGFTLERDVEVVTIRSFAVVHSPPFSLPRPKGGTPSYVEREVMIGGSWVRVKVYRRDTLPTGYEIQGPALVEEYSSTTLVKEGWTGRIHETGSMILEGNT